MTCNCGQPGLSEIFTADSARRDAARYRKRGLDQRARKLLTLIHATTDLRGRTTLEIGAGAGALSIELVREGAARAFAIDATEAVVRVAIDLAAERGFADRTSFEVGDFSADAARLPAADVVILDRVLCCFADWRGLLQPAAEHATLVIALSYPADTRWNRIAVAALNRVQSILGRSFRIHLHSPDLFNQLLREAGFDLARQNRYWFWELLVAERRPDVTQR